MSRSPDVLTSPARGLVASPSGGDSSPVWPDTGSTFRSSLSSIFRSVRSSEPWFMFPGGWGPIWREPAPVQDACRQRTFHRRLVDSGKSGTVAVTAVVRKLRARDPGGPTHGHGGWCRGPSRESRGRVTAMNGRGKPDIFTSLGSRTSSRRPGTGDLAMASAAGLPRGQRPARAEEAGCWSADFSPQGRSSVPVLLRPGGMRADALDPWIPARRRRTALRPRIPPGPDIRDGRDLFHILLPQLAQQHVLGPRHPGCGL